MKRTSPGDTPKQILSTAGVELPLYVYDTQRFHRSLASQRMSQTKDVFLPIYQPCLNEYGAMQYSTHLLLAAVAQEVGPVDL